MWCDGLGPCGVGTWRWQGLVAVVVILVLVVVGIIVGGVIAYRRAHRNMHTIAEDYRRMDEMTGEGVSEKAGLTGQL
jgi:hypothetical protein